MKTYRYAEIPEEFLREFGRGRALMALSKEVFLESSTELMGEIFDEISVCACIDAPNLEAELKCVWESSIAQICNELLITTCLECDEPRLQADMIGVEDEWYIQVVADREICSACKKEWDGKDKHEYAREIRGDRACHEDMGV